MAASQGQREAVWTKYGGCGTGTRKKGTHIRSDELVLWLIF